MCGYRERESLEFLRIFASFGTFGICLMVVFFFLSVRFHHGEKGKRENNCIRGSLSKVLLDYDSCWVF